MSKEFYDLENTLNQDKLRVVNGERERMREREREREKVKNWPHDHKLR